MTRASQKKEERTILDHYLEVIKQPIEAVECSEAPDFIVRIEGSKVGVEILSYHTPDQISGGFTRRQVEAEWENIRGEVRRFRESRPFLDELSVFLEFKALNVPSSSEARCFIEATADLIETHTPHSGDSFRYIDINQDHPEILRLYVRRLRIRRVGCYMEWDWNHDFGRIGTSDEKMINVIGRKLSSYKGLQGLSTSILIVAGWGGHISEIIAPLSAEQFDGFSKLNEEIEKSHFDKVVLLCFRYLVWERGKGWREIPKA